MLARHLKWALIALLLASLLCGGRIAGTGARNWLPASLLVFVLAEALMVAFAYIVARRRASPLATDGGLAAALACALREWAAFSFFYVVIQPFEHFWMGDDASGPAAPGEKPVLLAHGYCCNRGLWLWMRRRLRASGISVATVNFEPALGDIDDFAEQLHERIEALLAHTGAGKIVLATHSMGGLVARAYLRRYGEDRIAALVTLGAPHHGTRLAPWGLGRNARQMEPGNAWLAELNAWKLLLPVTCVASAGDEFVAPQDSALLPGARQVVLAGHDHFGLVLSDQVFSIIREAALSAPEMAG